MAATSAEFPSPQTPIVQGDPRPMDRYWRRYFWGLAQTVLGWQNTNTAGLASHAVDTTTHGVTTGAIAGTLDPRFPTLSEKAALAGTGTPSGSNKYVTADSFTSHANNTSNPHSVTASQAGAPALSLLTTLGDVPYRDGSSWARLAGPAADGTYVLREAVSGGVPGAPSWLGVGVASGLASLDGNSKVVQDPANATATPSQNKIPIASGLAGTIDAGWLPDLSATYATAARGVTNGNSHDHSGGDGAQIDHGGLAGLSDDDHAQYHNDTRAGTWHSGLSGYHATNEAGDTNNFLTAFANGTFSKARPTWANIDKTTSSLADIATRNYSDLSGIPSTFAPSGHQLDSATHTVSGLTPGHFLKATGAGTFGFAAHGLGYADVGACASNDSRLTDDRTASGLRSATTIVSVSAATAPSSGQVLTATANNAATWQQAPGAPSGTGYGHITGGVWDTPSDALLCSGLTVSGDATANKDAAWTDATSGEKWIWRHEKHAAFNSFSLYYDNGSEHKYLEVTGAGKILPGLAATKIVATDGSSQLDVLSYSSNGGASTIPFPDVSASVRIGASAGAPAKVGGAVTTHTQIVNLDGYVSSGGAALAADGCYQAGSAAFYTGNNYNWVAGLGRNFAVRSTSPGSDDYFTPVTHASAGYQGLVLDGWGTLRFYAELGIATTAGSPVSPVECFSVSPGGALTALASVSAPMLTSTASHLDASGNLYLNALTTGDRASSLVAYCAGEAWQTGGYLIYRGAGVNGNMIVRSHGTGSMSVYTYDAASLILGTNNTNRVEITAAGEIILGKTSMWTDGSIDVGQGGTGNRTAYIDLHGDDTYTDYALRIIRGDSGPNAPTEILHRGTEYLSLNAVDAGGVAIKTANTSRMLFGATGAIHLPEFTAGTLLTIDVNKNMVTQAFSANGGASVVPIASAAGSLRIDPTAAAPAKISGAATGHTSIVNLGGYVGVGGTTQSTGDGLIHAAGMGFFSSNNYHGYTIVGLNMASRSANNTDYIYTPLATDWFGSHGIEFSHDSHIRFLRYSSACTAGADISPTCDFQITGAGAINIPGLTATRLLAVDGSKNVVSSAHLYDANTIDIASGGSGDRNASIRLVSQDSAPNGYSAELIRFGGANGICGLYNQGTGELQVTQANAGDIVFATSNTERGRFDDSEGALTLANLTASTPLLASSAKGIISAAAPTTTELTSNTVDLSDHSYHSVAQVSLSAGKYEISGQVMLKSDTAFVAEAHIWEQDRSSVAKTQDDVPANAYRTLVIAPTIVTINGTPRTVDLYVKASAGTTVAAYGNQKATYLTVHQVSK